MVCKLMATLLYGLLSCVGLPGLGRVVAPFQSPHVPCSFPYSRAMIFPEGTIENLGGRALPCSTLGILSYFQKSLLHIPEAHLLLC